MVFTQMVIAFDAFQGNKNERDFIIKCLSIVNVTTNQVQQFDFAPPFDWSRLSTLSKKQNHYLTTRIHGLNWYSGEIPHEELNRVLKEKTDHVVTLYAKGEVVCTFLENILGRTVYNLENTVMLFLPVDTLQNVLDNNLKNIIFKCGANHDGYDWSISEQTRLTGCCFTRALRMAEIVKAYNRYNNIQALKITRGNDIAYKKDYHPNDGSKKYKKKNN